MSLPISGANQDTGMAFLNGKYHHWRVTAENVASSICPHAEALSGTSTICLLPANCKTNKSKQTKKQKTTSQHYQNFQLKVNLALPLTNTRTLPYLLQKNKVNKEKITYATHTLVPSKLQTWYNNRGRNYVKFCVVTVAWETTSLVTTIHSQHVSISISLRLWETQTCSIGVKTEKEKKKHNNKTNLKEKGENELKICCCCTFRYV